jgi:hypothetical protein
VREVATADRIRALLAGLAAAAAPGTAMYVVGGTSAVLVGWRESTRDVDLVIHPDSDAVLRAIPRLKEQLRINVEIAGPDHFIPVPAAWRARSPVIEHIGAVTIHHYDFISQALAKLERGHTRDLADVRAMLSRGLVTPEALRAGFAEIEPQLYRYPAVDVASFRTTIDSVLRES